MMLKRHMRRTWPRGYDVLGIAAAVLTVGLLAPAAPANADSQIYGEAGDRNAFAYSLELQDDGWGMTAAQARQNAATVCGEHALGMTRHQIIQRFENGGNTFDIAFDLAWGAEYHFCPAYLA